MSEAALTLPSLTGRRSLVRRRWKKPRRPTFWRAIGYWFLGRILISALDGSLEGVAFNAGFAFVSFEIDRNQRRGDVVRARRWLLVYFYSLVAVTLVSIVRGAVATI